MHYQVKSTGNAIFYALLLSFSGWYFGYCVGLFNSFLNTFLLHAYSISDEEEIKFVAGNLNLSLMIGGMVSCISAGQMIELLGRYNSVILFLVGEVVTIVLSLYTNLNLLYILRFFHGYFACSWTFLGPLMLKENLPHKYANVFGSCFYIFITLGILTSYIFGFDEAGVYWRLIFLLPLVFDLPKLLLFMTFYRMESVKWIFFRYKDKEVRAALMKKNLRLMYKEEDIDAMTEFFIEEYHMISKNDEKTHISDLFSSNYRLQFFIGILLNFLNQMTGINFLIFYSDKIFTQLGLPNPALLTFFMGFMNTLGAIFITIFVNKIGKKTGLVLGLALQSLAYFIFLFGFTFEIGVMCVIGSYLFIFSFAISLGGIIYSYLVDIVPAIGIGIASFIQWIIGMLVGKYALNIIDAVGIYAVFVFFMSMSLIGCVLIAGYGVETKGKEDHEIKDAFLKKRFLD